MGGRHFEVWEGRMCNVYSLYMCVFIMYVCIHYICVYSLCMCVVYSLCMCVFIIYVSGKTRVDLRRSSGFCSGGTSKSLLFVDEVLYPQ